MFRLRSRFLLLLPMVHAKGSNSVTVHDEAQLQPGNIGFDRIVSVFSRREDGTWSPEVNRIIFTSTLGMMCGSLYGGLLASARSGENHLETNLATRYDSKHHAIKAVQHRVLKDFLKGSLHVGFRTMIFLGAFQTFLTLLYVHSGTMKAYHYAIAGGLTGALHKIHSGPKAAFSGGLFASSLGMIGGAIIHLVLYLTGQNINEVFDARARYEQEMQETRAKRAQKSEDSVVPEVKEMYENLKGRNQ